MEIVILVNKFKITIIELFKHIEEGLHNIAIEVETMIEKYLGFQEEENMSSEIRNSIV